VLSAVIIQRPDLVREVMGGQATVDPTGIDRHVVAVPDNLRQLA
jgi:hypothetical protein